MGFFDDIVPPDGASSYVATPPGVPRITVRPSFETGAVRPPQDEGVEPPPEPENAAPTFADASDGTDNAPPARRSVREKLQQTGCHLASLGRWLGRPVAACLKLAELLPVHGRRLEGGRTGPARARGTVAALRDL